MPTAAEEELAARHLAVSGGLPPSSEPATTAPALPRPTGPTSSGAAVSNANAASGLPLPVVVPEKGSSSVAAVTDGAAEAVGSSVVPAVAEERRTLPLAYDESRKLFQRLWTDDDEVKILQGFLEFTSRRGTTFASHQYDTGPFYEDIKKQLPLEFSKNQLVEKLRRLKKKYRNCVGRMHAAGDGFSFRSTHEKAIFDIAHKIWSAGVKRSHDSDDDDDGDINAGKAHSNEFFTVPVKEGPLTCDRGFSTSRRSSKRCHAEEAAPAPVAVVATAPETTATEADNSSPGICAPVEPVAGLPSMVEETMRSCLSPLFKELINSAIARPFTPGLGGCAAATLPEVLPLGLGNSPMPVAWMPMDEKWRGQQILELEVYLKRIEFVRDQVKAMLKELECPPS